MQRPPYRVDQFIYSFSSRSKFPLLFSLGIAVCIFLWVLSRRFRTITSLWPGFAKRTAKEPLLPPPCVAEFSSEKTKHDILWIDKKTAMLIPGHPPSPPQSTNGATPEPQQSSCGVNHPLYSQTSAFDSAALPPNGGVAETAYGSSPQSVMSYHNSSFPHNMPLHSTQMGGQVETPPPTSDDDFLRASSESAPSQWLSPSPERSKVRPTRKTSKSLRSPRRTGGRQRKIDFTSMPGPLSQLTKGMTDVPIKDMEAWVNRSVEVRQQEAKQKGKVARPMNSFMLYRSAYSERAQRWFSQNNHQVVSRMAGESWRHETPEVRRRYEQLAKIEKANHARAHPGYRFAPEKDKKKRSRSLDERRSKDSGSTSQSSHPSMISRPSGASPFMGGHARSISSDQGSLWDSRDSTPFGFADHGFPAGGYLNSSWHSNNPGRPAPGMMASPMMSSPEPSQYLQQTVQPSLMGAHVEDVRLRRVGMHDIPYTTSTGLAGLPGATHHELLQPQTAPGAGPNGQLDPQLLAFQGDVTNGGGNMYGNSSYSMWQEPAGANAYLPINPLSPTSMAGNIGTGYQGGVSGMMENRDSWDPNPNHEASLETGGEFDSWLNPHQSGY